MADDKNITQVNAAGALQATDLIPVAQGDARLRRATAQQVADFVSGAHGVINVKARGAVGNGTTDDTAALTAAAAASPVIFAPRGRYSTTLNEFGLSNTRQTGDGQFIMGGYAQARDRSLLTADPGDPDEGRYRVFDEIPDAMQGASYMFVGSAVGQTPGVTYRSLTLAAKNLNVYDFVGGHNTSLADHAGGRTGAFQYVDRLYHGGQGDLVNQTFYGEVYSARPSATHFLANPAIIHTNGGFAATGAATGAYLQHSEYIYNDNGLAVAAVDRVRNYIRTNAGNALNQVWIHDRPQSNGTQPIDVFYSPAGLAKRGLDFAAADFTADRAAIVLKANDRIYGAGAATLDPLNIRWFADQLGAPYLTWNSAASGWDFVATNNTPALRLRGVASSVNFLDLEARESGLGPILTTAGGDANVDFNLTTKGSGQFVFRTGSFGASQVLIQHVASANRMLTLAGSNGDAPQVGTSAGDLVLAPATGVVRFGTHSSSSDVAIAGFITIKDSGGTTRKLAVIA